MASEPIITKEAEFSQLRNDLYWKVFGGADGIVRFTGYDDDFWWANVCPKTDWRTRIGKVTGHRYFLDPHSNEVTIYAVSDQPA